MRKIYIALSLIGALMSSALATGLYDCNSGDRSNWKTMDELKGQNESQRLESSPHQKRTEVVTKPMERTPEGQRVEAYFHPVTLEKHLVARRGKILFQK